MQLYFIAVEKFGPSNPESWSTWVAGGTRFKEIVTLDHHLCPSVLNEILVNDWPHIVNEDFMLHFSSISRTSSAGSLEFPTATFSPATVIP